MLKMNYSKIKKDLEREENELKELESIEEGLKIFEELNIKVIK